MRKVIVFIVVIALILSVVVPSVMILLPQEVASTATGTTAQ